MNTSHLRGLDLNLLRIFLALLEEGSVTRAGVRLGLTQSAVSHALNRLRYTLGDDLFVRGPSGMQPTVRAVEIAPRIRLGLDQLQAALAPTDFTPAETDRRFVLAMGPYPASVLMPWVVGKVAAEAPRASIRLRSPDPPVAEDLDMGRCDILMSVFERTPDRFESEPVFSDRLVWAMRHDHPLADAPLTLERLAAAPHVVVASSDTPDLMHGSLMEHGLERRVVMDDRLAERLAAAGLERRVGVTVADVHSALAIVAASDLITPTPLGLFQRFGQTLKLKALDPPYPSPPRAIHALWRKDNDGPALQWLRGLLRDAGARFMTERPGV